MGCVGSQEKDPKDSEVQKTLNKDKAKDAEIKKLLLLGAGGSGKSTLFKQLQTIHGEPFSERDRRLFRSQIHEQIIEAMKTMLMKCEEYIEDYEEENKSIDPEKYRINQKNEDLSELILSTRNNATITMNNNLINAIETLWKDNAIKNMFEERNNICVPDSTEYFLNDLPRITASTYVPSDADLLLVRYRTTGMAEKTLYIDDHTFQICDVGGQRNERRKWIHFFDSVTAVIFVAALSSYNEVTFEDETANAMHESIMVFEEQTNSVTFSETAFILFLNKSDLFEQKIKKVPLTVCWKEYNGEQTYDAGIDWIRLKFEETNKNKDRQIYSHVTCATDQNNVKRVFNDVQHIVINWSLERSGLI